MNAVQVPLWVTLALAAIALVRPLGSALITGTITARRDDHRWEREARREDSRWEREREKLRHERILVWRDKRLEYYGQILAVIEAQYEVLQRHTGLSFIAISEWESYRGDSTDLEDEEIDEIFRNVRLIASSGSVVMAEKLLVKLRVTVSKLRHPAWSHEPTSEPNKRLVRDFGNEGYSQLTN